MLDNLSYVKNFKSKLHLLARLSFPQLALSQKAYANHLAENHSVTVTADLQCWVTLLGVSMADYFQT